MRILGKIWRPKTSEEISGPSSRGPHRLSACLVCQTQWAERYIVGRVPIRQKSFTHIGSLVHAIRQYRNAEREAELPLWYHKDPEREHVARVADGRHDLIVESNQVSKAYDRYWKGADLHAVEATELEVYATLGEMFPRWDLPDYLRREVVTARTDVIERLPSGEVSWVDLKCSAGNYKTDKLATWNPRKNEYRSAFQTLWGLRIGRAHYAREDLYMRSFVILRIKRAGTFESDKHAIMISDRAYAQSGRQLINAVIREFELKAKLDAHEPFEQEGIGRGACVGRYGRCDYFDLCQADTLEDRATIVADAFKKRG